MADNGPMMLQTLKGCKLEHELWRPVLRRIVSTADVGESGQISTSNAAVAPNLGSRGNSGQGVGVRSCTRTPFSGGHQVRAGEAVAEISKGFGRNTNPTQSGNPTHSLRPARARVGRDDSGVTQVLSPEARAKRLHAIRNELQKLQ